MLEIKRRRRAEPHVELSGRLGNWRRQQARRFQSRAVRIIANIPEQGSPFSSVTKTEATPLSLEIKL